MIQREKSRARAKGHRSTKAAARTARRIGRHVQHPLGTASQLRGTAGHVRRPPRPPARGLDYAPRRPFSAPSTPRPTARTRGRRWPNRRSRRVPGHHRHDCRRRSHAAQPSSSTADSPARPRAAQQQPGEVERDVDGEDDGGGLRCARLRHRSRQAGRVNGGRPACLRRVRTPIPAFSHMGFCRACAQAGAGVAIGAESQRRGCGAARGECGWSGRAVAHLGGMGYKLILSTMLLRSLRSGAAEGRREMNRREERTRRRRSVQRN